MSPVARFGRLAAAKLAAWTVMRRVGLAATAALACTACGLLRPVAPPGLEIADGYRIELFATGLNGPTQMIFVSGEIWLAQLAGPENAGSGQILSIDMFEPDQRRVLLEGLFKPTGLARTRDHLWIASGRDLLRAPLDNQGLPTEPEIVFKDLPFNGRSNGTLTVTPEGQLVYETSGSRRGGTAVAGSASLWLLDPEDPSEPELLATGLKNAYAHVFDEQRGLWVTEIADDPVNGEPPPDELNLIRPGRDYGWPACYGDRQPASNYGGTERSCLQTEPPVAVFPPRSTPTGVLHLPGEADSMLVALWGPTQPSVVLVRYRFDGLRAHALEITPFLTGLAHPQSLLRLSPDSVLVSDFESGNLYRITRR